MCHVSSFQRGKQFESQSLFTTPQISQARVLHKDTIYDSCNNSKRFEGGSRTAFHSYGVLSSFFPLSLALSLSLSLLLFFCFFFHTLSPFPVSFESLFSDIFLALFDCWTRMLSSWRWDGEGSYLLNRQSGSVWVPRSKYNAPPLSGGRAAHGRSRHTQTSCASKASLKRT